MIFSKNKKGLPMRILAVVVVGMLLITSVATGQASAVTTTQPTAIISMAPPHDNITTTTNTAFSHMLSTPGEGVITGVEW